MGNSESTRFNNQETANQTTINQETLSEERLYHKRYDLCWRLLNNDNRFKAMSEEEKDAYAQRLATPEYLDLTCDWRSSTCSRTIQTCS